jgi:hypothetical protein
VGGDILSFAIRSTQYGGTIASCGNAASGDLPLTVYPFILRGSRSPGSIPPLPHVDTAHGVGTLAGDWKIAQMDRITTEIGLEDLNSRIDTMLAGGNIGRCIVDLGNPLGIPDDMFDFDTASSIANKRTARNGASIQQAGIIPMWVADMDFQSPPAVMEALHERVAHGVFGYGGPDPQLKSTIVDHLQNAYGWHVAREWIIWLPGLVTGINVACRGVGRKGRGNSDHHPGLPAFFNCTGPGAKTAAHGTRWCMMAGDGKWTGMPCGVP